MSRVKSVIHEAHFLRLPFQMLDQNGEASVWPSGALRTLRSASFQTTEGIEHVTVS